MEAGADIFVVQSTVTTVRHKATKYKPFDITAFCKKMKIPVIVGNCVTYSVATELMEAGVSGLLVGVGPGAACTTAAFLAAHIISKMKRFVKVLTCHSE
jgi:IMP dehydrogenase